MTQNKLDDGNKKMKQIAAALATYLIRHDIIGTAESISIAEWAKQAAKAENENLIVNTYEHVALKLMNESTMTEKSPYIVYSLRDGKLEVFYDMTAWLNYVNENLDKEESI